MKRNIRLVVAYDGTDFHGWQRQPGFRTVQSTLEATACRVVRHPVKINGSGRTDAGVHAAGQVANFITECEIPTEKIQKAIGSRLPADVAILSAKEVPLAFRSSSDAVSKLYRYTIHNHRLRAVDKLRQRYVYHCWHRLDAERMQQAARHLVGEHDFAAFAARGNDRLTTVRTILRLEVRQQWEEISIDVEGTGFLYNQVRNIAGTLIEVGRGHWEPDRVKRILESCDRSQAGPTAPAQGLCLQWVRYDLVNHPGKSTDDILDVGDPLAEKCQRTGDRT